MNEVDLFIDLGKKKKSFILELLENAYFEMNSEQRQCVFGQYVNNKINKTKLNDVNADEILDDILAFHKESKSGYYYEPFDINSKNYMDIPEETTEWCNKIGMYLDQTSQVSIQGFHETAVKCFKILFDLVDALGDDNIIFADEIGTWMVGGNEEQAFKCYITSLSDYCTPKDFVEHIIPLLKRDGYESFSNKVYAKALSIANKDQITLLKAEIKLLKIRIK